MPLRYLLTKARHDRFERFNIVVSILLAAWVPSILTVWFSYAFLTKMLESRILRDRQTFVQLISRLVGDDLSRTEGIIDYYQTLPDILRILSSRIRNRLLNNGSAPLSMPIRESTECFSPAGTGD